MKLENQDFDKRLIELNAQIAKLNNEIENVSKEREAYMLGNRRKDFLFRNSLTLDSVTLEKADGYYYIVAEDDTFEYVMRLTKEQAETIADDLDDQLGKDLQLKVDQSSNIIQNMFNPLFQNMNKK